MPKKYRKSLNNLRATIPAETINNHTFDRLDFFIQRINIAEKIQNLVSDHYGVIINMMDSTHNNILVLKQTMHKNHEK